MGLTRKLEGIASSARAKFPIFNGKMSWISYLKPFKIAGELINGYKNQAGLVENDSHNIAPSIRDSSFYGTET